MTMRELLPLVLDSAVKGTVILALAGVAAVWLRQASAAARHLVWQLGMIGLLALPIVAAMNPWRLAVLPSFTVPAFSVTAGAENKVGAAPTIATLPLPEVKRQEENNAEYSEPP